MIEGVAQIVLILQVIKVWPIADADTGYISSASQATDVTVFYLAI